MCWSCRYLTISPIPVSTGYGKDPSGYVERAFDAKCTNVIDSSSVQANRTSINGIGSLEVPHWQEPPWPPFWWRLGVGSSVIPSVSSLWEYEYGPARNGWCHYRVHSGQIKFDWSTRFWCINLNFIGPSWVEIQPPLPIFVLSFPPLEWRQFLFCIPITTSTIKSFERREQIFLFINNQRLSWWRLSIILFESASLFSSGDQTK